MAERLAIGNNARTFVSQGVQARGEWRYEGEWFGNVLEAGVRYHMDEIRHHTQAEYDMVAGTTVRATDAETIRRNTGAPTWSARMCSMNCSSATASD